MKKTVLINSNISNVIANLGHTDKIVLADAGLPVPKGIEKIDLAIKLGLPKFLDVLKVIAKEASFEKVFFSKEILNHFPKLVDQVKNILGHDCNFELIPHEDFKKILLDTKAVIRTGENKWFHNIILQSAVTF